MRWARRKNKGPKWSHTCFLLKEKRKTVLKDHPDLTHSERGKKILRDAQQAAECLVKAVKTKPEMLTAFANAGIRYAALDRELGKGLREAFDAFANSTPETLRANWDKLTEMEITCESRMNYECCEERGAQQQEFLKALDFSDHWTPNLYCFNVCRAQIGSSGTCGLCMPAQLWTQEDPNKWKFKCACDWNKLVEAAKARPEDQNLKEWVDAMKHKHGDDIQEWPKIGCQAVFKPWARGPSKALQMREDENAKWWILMAEYIPAIIDDEIKKVQQHFYEAAKHLTAESLKAAIQVSFPAIYNEKDMPGISRFPIDEWTEKGQPYLTTRGWCDMVVKIAQHDMKNLGRLFAVSEKVMEAIGEEQKLVGYLGNLTIGETGQSGVSQLIPGGPGQASASSSSAHPALQDIGRDSDWERVEHESESYTHVQK